MEIKMQVVMGKKSRQFFEHNSMSPGSLKKPSRPSVIINKPATIVKRPIKTKSFPNCCGPLSIRVSQYNILITDAVEI
jgi:hypothetical protein